jgi:hypothetical protein
MNRYNYKTSHKWNILKRVAKLREQRKLIKAIYSMRKEDNSLTDSDGSLKFNALFGNFLSGEIIGLMNKKPLFIGEKVGNFPTNKNEEGFLDRCSRIGVLVQSCVDSEFIVPTKNIRSSSEEVSAYRITNKGSDLLHFVGFWQIAFEKYSRTIIFLSGILSVVAVKAIAFLVSHWHQT